MGNGLTKTETKKTRIQRLRFEYIESLLETDSSIGATDTISPNDGTYASTEGPDTSGREDALSNTGEQDNEPEGEARLSALLSEDTFSGTRRLEALTMSEGRLFGVAEMVTPCLRGEGVSDTRRMDEVSVSEGGVLSFGPITTPSCPADLRFPFENIVFEDGGNKGLAYCGAVKYLEEIGVMPNVKRMAGASAGAMTAALLAVGCTADEIKAYLGQDLQQVFLDGSYFKAIFNLFWNFGFHPANRLYAWLGETLKEKTGSADVTFEEVRKQFGRELCVVVTNINWGRIEYFHPKTTPDTPVRLALRMSSTIPGLFTAKSYSLLGESDVFVDGGVLCNFPIHCFDGWFLSMSEDDNFIEKLDQHGGDLTTFDEDKFKKETFDHKTLGFQLFSEHEPELRRSALEHKSGIPLPERPEEETNLYRKWKKEHGKHERAKAIQNLLREAKDIFLRIVKEHTIDKALERESFIGALSEGSLSKAHMDILFGKDVSPSYFFDSLDHDRNGKIDSRELFAFIGTLAIHLENSSCNFRRPVQNLFSFASSIQSTITVNTKRICVKSSDVDRTVGINTGHVTTTDFVLEKSDREFLVQRGYNACKTFLQRYVEENNLPLKN